MVQTTIGQDVSDQFKDRFVNGATVSVVQVRLPEVMRLTVHEQDGIELFTETDKLLAVHLVYDAEEFAGDINARIEAGEEPSDEEVMQMLTMQDSTDVVEIVVTNDDNAMGPAIFSTENATLSEAINEFENDL